MTQCFSRPSCFNIKTQFFTHDHKSRRGFSSCLHSRDIEIRCRDGGLTSRPNLGNETIASLGRPFEESGVSRIMVGHARLCKAWLCLLSIPPHITHQKSISIIPSAQRFIRMVKRMHSLSAMKVPEPALLIPWSLEFCLCFPDFQFLHPESHPVLISLAPSYWRCNGVSVLFQDKVTGITYFRSQY